MSTVATSTREIRRFVDPEIRELPAIEPKTDICGIRPAQVWGKFHITEEGRPTMVLFDRFRQGIMLDVRFKGLWAPGHCGAAGDYTGHAIGDLLEGVKPDPRKLQGARQLHFNRCNGAFLDGASGNPLIRCTALFLLPGLKARYIP